MKALDLIMERPLFFLNLLKEHIIISGIAIIIAITLGLFLGILATEYKQTRKITLNLTSFIYTIPAISMFGFLIPISGIGNKSAIIALSIYGLLPMVRNTYTGLTTIDPLIIEAATAMGTSKRQLLTKIKLPLAMPIIISGVRNLAVMTISLAGIASFIGAGGLGVAIYRGITTNNTAMTVAGSIIIALLALLTDFSFGLLEKKINQPKSKQRNFKKGLSIVAVLLLIASLGAYGLKTSQERKTIRVATKPMTEQYIIGNMVKILIETDTNLHVDLTTGVGGGTANIQPALEAKEFDLYPEYTGTAWNAVLKEKSEYKEADLGKLQAEYAKMGLVFSNQLGFNNTYGVAISKELADKYDINTISDLQKIDQDITFGAEYDFYEREDGFDKLSSAYNLKFKKTNDLDIGLKYNAIKSGEIDAMSIFTTDGQLSTPEIKVLKDDKHLYPNYNAGFVIRKEVLDDHPSLQPELDKLTGQISEADMAKMSYQVETKKMAPETVARNFLESKNLIDEGGNDGNN